MYRIEDLRKVGWVSIWGGLGTVGLGIIAQLTVGLDPVSSLLTNLLYMVLFGVGWFFFNQLVMATVFNKLVDDEKRAKLDRLADPLTTPPPGRWGQPFQRVEALLMCFWAFSVAVIQLALGQNLSVPVAGVAAGWLIGSGVGRLRFARMVGREQTDQQRLFYFSDATLGPATEAAYYSDRPDEPLNRTTAANTTPESLPPGIKRRGQISAAGKPDRSN